MKNAIKAVYQAIEEQSAEKAQDALRAAIPVIDRTAAKADLHKKNVSRKVSRLTRRVNAFVAEMQSAQAAAERLRLSGLKKTLITASFSELPCSRSMAPRS